MLLAVLAAVKRVFFTVQMLGEPGDPWLMYLHVCGYRIKRQQKLQLIDLRHNAKRNGYLC